MGIIVVWLVLTLLDILEVPLIHMHSMPGMSLQTELLGFSCVFLNTLMYGSPLVVVQNVVRTRSVEFMPLPLSVMTFACSCCWFSYSLLVGDPWIMIPNAMGLALGILQLSIYAYFYKQSGASRHLTESLTA